MNTVQSQFSRNRGGIPEKRQVHMDSINNVLNDSKFMGQSQNVIQLVPKPQLQLKTRIKRFEPSKIYRANYEEYMHSVHKRNDN